MIQTKKNNMSNFSLTRCGCKSASYTEETLHWYPAYTKSPPAAWQRSPPLLPAKVQSLLEECGDVEVCGRNAAPAVSM